MQRKYHLTIIGRAPRGARGLKFAMPFFGFGTFGSRPARGAWIEINMGIGYELEPEVAPREGRVD